MISIVSYHETYEKEVQALYAIPLSGMISLSLERQPHSLIGARVQTEEPQIFIVIEKTNNEVVAIFNTGKRRQYYKGKIINFPYLCDLRIRPDYQKSSVLLRIIRFLRQLDLNINNIPATTVVFGDNIPMISLIEKRAKMTVPTIIPLYQKIADIETFIFRSQPSHWKKNGRHEIRRATKEDTPLMQALQERNVHDYMMYYEFEKLGKTAYYHDLNISDYFLVFENQKLVGMMGTWHTSGFKQTRVHKYHWLIAAVKPLYNLVAANILQFPRLPKSGELIQTLQIHSIIIEDRKQAIFQSLLQAVLKTADLPLMISLDKKDPLYPGLQAVKSAIKKQGHVYLVTDGATFQIPSWIPLDVVRI